MRPLDVEPWLETFPLDCVIAELAVLVRSASRVSGANAGILQEIVVAHRSVYTMISATSHWSTRDVAVLTEYSMLWIVVDSRSRNDRTLLDLPISLTAPSQSVRLALDKSTSVVVVE